MGMAAEGVRAGRERGGGPATIGRGRTTIGRGRGGGGGPGADSARRRPRSDLSS